MNKISVLLGNMFVVANILDEVDMKKEADVIDAIMVKVAIGNENKQMRDLDDYEKNPNIFAEYMQQTQRLTNKYQNIVDGKMDKFSEDVDKELIKRILSKSDIVKGKLLRQYEVISSAKGVKEANKEISRVV